MGVARQHGIRPMAAHAHNLFGGQALLKQPRHRLMPEIVEVEILDLGQPTSLAPVVFQAVLTDREERAIRIT
jgi:hypothetical protein